MKTQATLTVHGPRQLLRAFRKRLIDSLRSDAPDVQFTEIHSKESLLLELAAPQGVPFPELIAISTQYPECVATVAWRQDMAQGETTIQNGQVKEAVRSAAQSARLPQYLRLAPDRSLVLGFVLDINPDGMLGFCASAEAETFFRLRGRDAEATLFTIGGNAMAWDEHWVAGADACSAIDPAMALTSSEQRSLDLLAGAFRAEWLWYDHAPEEDSIVERQRYADAGRPVRAINVKSRKLAEHPGNLVSSLAANQDWIAERLLQTWGHH